MQQRGRKKTRTCSHGSSLWAITSVAALVVEMRRWCSWNCLAIHVHNTLSKAYHLLNLQCTTDVLASMKLFHSNAITFLQLGLFLVAVDDLNAADFHYMKPWPNVDTLWQTITLWNLLSSAYISSNRSWDAGGPLSCIMYVVSTPGKKMDRYTNITTTTSAMSNKKRKKWLEKGSAYNVLKPVVLSKDLLRDLSQMTLFKHTGKFG